MSHRPVTVVPVRAAADVGVGFGLFDPGFVANPEAPLARLREDAPVQRDPETGLWLVSRHSDIRAVLADPEAFRPDNALTAVTPLPVPTLRMLARAGFALPPTLANNGTESHAGLRRVVASFLTPSQVDRAMELTRRLVADGVGRARRHLAENGQCDLVELIARDLPCSVLLHVLGIGDVDLPVLKAWSRASLELFWGNPDPERQRRLAEEAAEFHQWLTARVRAAKPDDPDLFGALVAHRKPDERPLRTVEAVGVCYFLLIAGQETTTQLLSTLLRRCIERPELWQRLAAGEAGLAADCVEEVLRREPPVITWRRVTAKATSVGGVELPAGAQLLLMLAGSGSDPEVFAEPERLCPGREGARRHLAFGYGRHFCLGAGLARAEAAVVLDAVARALPGLRLLEPDPPMLGLLSFRAPTRLQVARA
ncbi:Cytochrome P450 [Allokutzneria albata]|uniref:Cytochrome P450 n=1 Tax=Allokutzneria albata TaxID=211114 RepID=A0A1G9X944_ALLAB|nr:Cytochrome P450 [Allokutzneria albata]